MSKNSDKEVEKMAEGLYLEIQEVKTNKLLEDWNKKGIISNADKVIMLILENQLTLMRKMKEMCTDLDI